MCVVQADHQISLKLTMSNQSTFQAVLSQQGVAQLDLT